MFMFIGWWGATIVFGFSTSTSLSLFGLFFLGLGFGRFRVRSPLTLPFLGFCLRLFSCSFVYFTVFLGVFFFLPTIQTFSLNFRGFVFHVRMVSWFCFLCQTKTPTFIAFVSGSWFSCWALLSIKTEAKHLSNYFIAYLLLFTSLLIFRLVSLLKHPCLQHQLAFIVCPDHLALFWFHNLSFFVLTHLSKTSAV